MSDQDDPDHLPDADEDDPDDELVVPPVPDEDDPDDEPEVPPPVPGAVILHTPHLPPIQVESPAVNAFSIGGFAIEGVQGNNAAHARSFYKHLIPMMQKAGPSWKLCTLEKFDSIMDVMVCVCVSDLQ
jgi:hypothetical protein